MSAHRQIVKSNHRGVAGNRKTIAAQGLDHAHRHGVGHGEKGRTLDFSADAHLPNEFLLVKGSEILKADINQMALRIVGDSGLGKRRNETLAPQIKRHPSCRADVHDLTMPKIEKMPSCEKSAKKIVGTDTVKAHHRVDAVDQ